MRVLITAGPTREPLDPVRYLTNRSSGKMGYALAAVALEAGYDVTLVSGPVSLEAPEGADLVSVETAREMYDAVEKKISEAEAAIFCAAVADYRLKEVAEEKIKKSDGELTLTLIKNPDILGSVRSGFGFKGILVGFAAETEKIEEHAKDKLRRKGCDLLVANDVSRTDIGFDHDENEVQFFFADGRERRISKANKREIAREIISEMEAIPAS